MRCSMAAPRGASAPWSKLAVSDFNWPAASLHCYVARLCDPPLMIEVEDTGPGVPDELKPHLFDPFVTTKRKGTGLGLALVAKIIGDHGGVIECESVPKRTVFRVLLPLQDKKQKRDQ